MRVRRALRAWLAAAVLSLALASGAHAAKPVPVSCGQTITKDTKLANDLTNCPANGIVIGADSITLDLNGHTIDGDGDGFDSCETACDAGVDNSAGHDGITIKDGAIREFVSGVDLVGANANRVRDLSTSHQAHGGVDVAESADVAIKRVSSVADGVGVSVVFSNNVRVERNSVSDNEFAAISLFGCDHVRIANSSVSRSGQAGILLSADSDHNRVDKNSVSESPEGVFLEGGSDHNVVSENWSFRNGEGVVLDPGTDHNLIRKNSLRDNRFNGLVLVASDDNVITQNSAVGNGDGSGAGDRGSDAGIHLFAIPDEPENTSDRNVVSQNTLVGNDPDGILVDAGQSQNVVEGNWSSQNTDDGIDVDSPATTLTRNIANRNHDLGIEAVPGVTDGGGNRASGNGNPLQCTNVFCR